MTRADDGDMRSIEDHEYQRFEHRAVVLTNGRLSRSTYSGPSEDLLGEWTRLGDELYFARLGAGEYLAFEQKDVKITITDTQVVRTGLSIWYDETGAVIDTEDINEVLDMAEITPDYYVLRIGGESWYYPYTITNVGGHRLFFHDLLSLEKME